jgi:hypothetical protein|nr:hypothetical protein [uncultured Campylobacter sp.]
MNKILKFFGAQNSEIYCLQNLKFRLFARNFAADLRVNFVCWASGGTAIPILKGKI